MLAPGTQPEQKMRKLVLASLMAVTLFSIVPATAKAN
jgi:hypothetical protein